MSFQIDNPEWAVLDCLIQKPQLVRSEEVAPEWFEYEPYQKLADFLNKAGGDLDYFGIRDGFEAEHPGELNRGDWDMVLTSGAVPAQFGGWVKMLRTRYYRKTTQDAASKYYQSASNTNFQAMVDAAQAYRANTEETHAEQSMADLAEEMHDKIHEGVLDNGIRTFTPIDTQLGGGLMPGRMLTIGARPGVGKSAFAVNLIIQALRQQPGLTVDMFSLEMTSAQNYDRFLSAMCSIDGRKLVNPMKSLNDAEIASVEAAGEKLKGYDLQLWDKALKLHQIVKGIRQRAAQAKNGYLAVIDYLGLIEVPGQSERRLQIEEVTRTFKLLTNELDIPIVLLSQLSRAVEMRQEKRPMLSDLRESGSIEQDSNAVGFLYYDDPEKTNTATRSVIFSLQKNREGSPGDVRFNFFANQVRFGVAYL